MKILAKAPSPFIRNERGWVRCVMEIDDRTATQLGPEFVEAAKLAAKGQAEAFAGATSISRMHYTDRPEYAQHASRVIAPKLGWTLAHSLTPSEETKDQAERLPKMSDENVPDMYSNEKGAHQAPVNPSDSSLTT